MGPGAGTEGGEGLQQLAETAAAHEVVFLSFDTFHRPDPDGDHDDEIDEDNRVVDPAHGLFSGERLRQESATEYTLRRQRMWPDSARRRRFSGIFSQLSLRERSISFAVA